MTFIDLCLLCVSIFISLFSLSHHSAGHQPYILADFLSVPLLTSSKGISNRINNDYCRIQGVYIFLSPQHEAYTIYIGNWSKTIYRLYVFIYFSLFMPKLIARWMSIDDDRCEYLTWSLLCSVYTDILNKIILE